MTVIQWTRYPSVSDDQYAKTWLTMQANLHRPNTVDAYGRGIEDYLLFGARNNFLVTSVTKEHIALWIKDLTTRSNPRAADPSLRLSNATIHQKLTSVRLFYDYLVEKDVCRKNPVGRGRYSPGKSQFDSQPVRGIFRRLKKLPWIPSEQEWDELINAAKNEPLRNRVMLGLSYDCALRREELCSLELRDFDLAHRTLRIRAETSKTARTRIAPYTEDTGILLREYFAYRRTLSLERGRLFLSESRRNYAQPITIWTWSKVVRAIADGCGVRDLSTHTFRHLRLTDLARCNWDINEIAEFAGHRDIETTRIYIHLSARDLIAKFQKGMASVNVWRTRRLGELMQ